MLPVPDGQPARVGSFNYAEPSAAGAARPAGAAGRATFHYSYMIATKMRDDMLSAGREEELEALIRTARELQDEVPPRCLSASCRPSASAVKLSPPTKVAPTADPRSHDPLGHMAVVRLRTWIRRYGTSSHPGRLHGCDVNGSHFKSKCPALPCRASPRLAPPCPGPRLRAADKRRAARAALRRSVRGRPCRSRKSVGR